MTTRADKLTNLIKKRTTWADFTLNLSVHPDTGDLFLITNENAIKSNLRNLVLTALYERFQQPTFGCNIRQTLFENFSAQSEYELQTIVKNAIVNFETRVSLITVSVAAQVDNYNLTITIEFYINNVADAQKLDITVTRIR